MLDAEFTHYGSKKHSNKKFKTLLEQLDFCIESELCMHFEDINIRVNEQKVNTVD